MGCEGGHEQEAPALVAPGHEHGAQRPLAAGAAGGGPAGGDALGSGASATEAEASAHAVTLEMGCEEMAETVVLGIAVVLLEPVERVVGDVHDVALAVAVVVSVYWPTTMSLAVAS